MDLAQLIKLKLFKYHVRNLFKTAEKMTECQV